MTNRPTIGISVITFNEQANIRECLESAKWADEIVVVDSFSTDVTLEIAREYTDRILQHKWDGINRQRQFALEQATTDWVFCLDADERITPELRDEINERFARGEPDCDGFLIPRRTWFVDRWIKHCGWYPDPKLRLFRRSKARFGDNDPHDQVLLDGATRRLRHDILHYTYRDLAHNVSTINTFSTVRGARLLEHGATTGVFDLILQPAWRFFWQYVVRLGFLDGRPGLIICIMSAFNVFLRQAKVWEGTQPASKERRE